MVAALGGEVVLYLPHNGTAKTFRALIERRPSRVDVAGGVQYTVNQIEVWLPMDATDGVLAVNERKDKIRFKKRLGDAEVTEFTVQKILNEDRGVGVMDGGMFHLEVTA